MNETTGTRNSAWSGPRPIFVGWVCVVAVVAWIVIRVWDGLFIPWWFNTDEVAFYYEVIRQLRLDFTQTFFDIPGTPYMTLSSLTTAAWWSVEKIFGLTNAGNPADFAFEHVQGVYTLMRGLTLGGYVVAVGLAYEIFRRAGSVITGVVSAVLLATLPIHVQYSHFVRTESLGLLLCLTAILGLLHPRTALRWQTYLAAGVLVGIAMGARYHFALSGLPVLLAIYFLHDRKRLRLDETTSSYRASLDAAVVLAGILAAGGVVTVLFKLGVIGPSRLTHTMLLTTAAGTQQYPGAKQAVGKLWILLGTGSLILAVVAQFGRSRTRLLPLVNAFTLCLLLGFAGGFLCSHPTFLWRGEFQLRSIQFYSDWVDPNLQALGPLARWGNVTRYYFTTALPEQWLQWSFLLGVIAILWSRRAVAVSFLVGAAICFIAHPVTMKLWPHHIIPWLPFLCYVAAYPFGLLIETVARRVTRPALAPALLVLVSGGALVAALSGRLAKANEYLDISRTRTIQITEMNKWLTAHVPPASFLAVSYYALNDEGFLKWIESSGVSVPQHVKRFQDVQIWWLQRSTLKGKTGYVCISRADISFFRDDAERKNPGSTYNPFTDPQFVELVTFGDGFYELKVFKFDLRGTDNH